MFIKHLLDTMSHTKYLRLSRKQRICPSSHEANILEINYLRGWYLTDFF